MSGVLGAGKSPRTDAQWARDVQQRLAKLESPQSTMRVGDWVLTSAADGSLQAVKPGVVTVLTDSAGNIVSTAVSAAATPVTATAPLTWQALWNLFTNNAQSTSTSSSPASEWITEIQTWLANLYKGFLTPTSDPFTELQTAANQLGQIWTQDVTEPINEYVEQAQAGVNSFLTKLGLLQTNATNLVLDPSFNNPALWSGDPGQQSEAVAHSGIYSWQLQGQG